MEIDNNKVIKGAIGGLLTGATAGALFYGYGTYMMMLGISALPSRLVNWKEEKMVKFAKEGGIAGVKSGALTGAMIGIPVGIVASLTIQITSSFFQKK
ncbi:MAG TPA: hypothetical protein VLE96_06700 [Chlamydiales bacterium]|nr:hypothetical protein [Chlamydiales bacterium]